MREDVTFAQLAEFVWFKETGTGFTGFPGGAASPLLGVFEGRAVYLLYNGILKELKAGIGEGNILTAEVFAALPPFAGAKIIYAAAERMGKSLEHERITFKQTPYELHL